MLQDLLKQRGISSRLDGEQLQGGVGEIPVAGFVRLMVEDSDYAAARAVIDEWETTTVPDPIPVPQVRIGWTPIALLLGLAIGIGGSYLYHRVPTNLQGSDSNDDGRLDEHWTYSASGALIKSEVDRNFDGRPDAVNYTDRDGRYESGESDDDFDGKFETQWRYQYGSIRSMETDTDGDGAAEIHTQFMHGVPYSSEYFVSGSDGPARVEYYRLGVLTHAEVDTDGDGRLDTRKTYSELGEVTGTEAIAPSP